MKKTFMLNLFLALSWTFLSGRLDALNFIEGLILGFIILFLIRNIFGFEQYYYKLFKSVGFFFYVLKEIILANLEVAYDVVTPGKRMRPGVVGIPLDAKTNLEITLLANIITLTPGTLSLDISHNKEILYVHTMYMRSADSFRREIKTGIERRLLEVTR